METPELVRNSRGAVRAYVLDGSSTIDPDSDIEAVWWEWDLQGQSVQDFEIMPLFISPNDSQLPCVPLRSERVEALLHAGLTGPEPGHSIRGCPGPVPPISSDGDAIPSKSMGAAAAFVEAYVPGNKPASSSQAKPFALRMRLVARDIDGLERAASVHVGDPLAAKARVAQPVSTSADVSISAAGSIALVPLDMLNTVWEVTRAFPEAGETSQSSADALQAATIESVDEVSTSLTGMVYGVTYTMRVRMQQVLTEELFGRAAAGETAVDEAVVSVRRHRPPTCIVSSWTISSRSNWLQ